MRTFPDLSASSASDGEGDEVVCEYLHGFVSYLSAKRSGGFFLEFGSGIYLSFRF